MRSAFGQEFDVPSGYLNTPSIGVPPVMAADALAEAVRSWRVGASRSYHFDEPVAVARAAFGRLVGFPAERVAIGSSVCSLVGLVAASLPDGATVLVAKGEFTSVSFPFAAQAKRGVRVEEADLADIPARAAEVDLVAVSAVQSGDGSVLDLAELRATARRAGTAVLLDVTQAVGWLPLEVNWADAVVAAGYKWLLSPKGVAWMAVSADLQARITPHYAGWCAGEDPWESTYGLPLRLASDARALNNSPVWLCQVAAAAVLPWLASLELTEVRDHCVGLANQLRAELGEKPGNSAITLVRRPDAMTRLSEAGVVASGRWGGARLGFHLYNTEADVRRVVEALRAG